MSEEAVAESATETASTETTAATETTTATPAAFDSAAHYQSYLVTLTDAERKDHAVRFKSVDDILDGNMKQRKELSSRVKVPDDKSTPEDIAAFRKAIKAGEKAEDYKAAMPEGYELGEVQTALLGAMQKAALDTGVPTASFEGFTKKYFEMEQAVQAKCAEEVATFQRDSTAALKKEYGQDFEKYVRSAENFIDTKLEEPGFIALLHKKIQIDGVTIELRSHPDMIRAMAKIGLRAGEGGVIGHSVDEQASLKSRYDKLRRDHPFGTSAYTPEIDRQLKELSRQLYD